MPYIPASIGERQSMRQCILPNAYQVHRSPPMTLEDPSRPGTPSPAPARVDHWRFHRPHAHLASAFGNDNFALKAEAFARFFGTPLFLGAQTLIVAIWIGVNALGLTSFDVYPFILLNLAFSLQAAYAAPLILLAQTRQAARDKVHSEADAQHRESLAIANAQSQFDAAQNTSQVLQLLEQNTRLTEATKQLSERIEQLTVEMHTHLYGASSKKST
jgi:uncharacterized membrane protein